MTPPLLAACCLVAMLAAPLAAVRAESPPCQVPAELQRIDMRLPHLAARLRAHKPVTVVAIGGGSTAGAAAGSPDLAYPSRLREALARRYPESAIVVVNKGVPRQSAEQMRERFPRDVFAEHPVLVIWETGIVDAVRSTPIDEFADAVQRGLGALNERGIDTILVDMQFSRTTTAMIDFDLYLSTLHQVGELDGVYVFPRFEMMRYWSEQNMFNFDEVAAGERTRLAARVYDCIGRRLASAIRLAVQ